MTNTENAPHFTIYTKPSCVQCNATKRAITKGGGTYTEIDLTKDEEALAEFKAAGLTTAPVVLGPDGTQWAGFRSDLIKWYFTKKEAA